MAFGAWKFFSENKWPDAVLTGLVAFASLVWIFLALVRLSRVASPSTEIASPSGRLTIPPLPGQRTEAKFHQQVFVFKVEVDWSNVAKANPFMVFTFWFFNGSSSDQIYFQRLSGHVCFNGEEQSREVEFLGDMGTHYGLGRYGFRIRQWLTDTTAKIIDEAISRTGSQMQFRFETVSAMIASAGDESKAAYRLDLPIVSMREGRTWITHV